MCVCANECACVGGWVFLCVNECVHECVLAVCFSVWVCLRVCVITQRILQVLLPDQFQILLDAFGRQCVFSEDQLIVVTTTVNL